MTSLDFAASRKNTGGAGTRDSIRAGDSAKRFDQLAMEFCVIAGKEYHGRIRALESRLRHRLMGGILGRPRCGMMRGLSGAGANHDAGTIGESPRWGQERLLGEVGGDFSRKSHAKD